MKISNHKLVGVNYTPSPSQSGLIVPRFLIIHYTAGRGFEQTSGTFMSKQSEVSAHLLIGRAGQVAQFVPFNKKAWHAGNSSWKNIVGLNGCSIGIELDNFGKLTRMSNGSWQTYFGRKVPASEVVVAAHKHGGPVTGWHAYTEEQIAALEDISLALFTTYKLEDVLGHEDIAPKRKMDPGPAFNMSALRGLLVGRNQDNPADHDDGHKDDDHRSIQGVLDSFPEFKNIPEFVGFNPNTNK